MVIDDLFVKYVAGDDVNEAIKIAGDVFEEAAFYFTGEFAKGLGTKVHFIYENTKYIPGYRFESSSKFGEYLQGVYITYRLVSQKCGFQSGRFLWLILCSRFF